jgi:hypothetical protein
MTSWACCSHDPGTLGPVGSGSEACAQLCQIEGDVERLEAQDALAAQVVNLPAVRLAAEVLDPRLGARDHQDVLERGDRTVVGELAVAIGGRGRKGKDFDDQDRLGDELLASVRHR